MKTFHKFLVANYSKSLGIFVRNNNIHLIVLEGQYIPSNELYIVISGKPENLHLQIFEVHHENIWQH